jgi:hypothetical protein
VLSETGRAVAWLHLLYCLHLPVNRNALSVRSHSSVVTPGHVVVAAAYPGRTSNRPVASMRIQPKRQRFTSCVQNRKGPQASRTISRRERQGDPPLFGSPQVLMRGPGICRGPEPHRDVLRTSSANRLAVEAVCCEPVSSANFPANREKYREFPRFSAIQWN